MLGGRGHPPGSEAQHGGPGACCHVARPAGEAAPAHDRGAHGHVGHGSEVHVHAQPAQLLRRPAVQLPHPAWRPLRGLAGLGTGKRQRPDGAALLIHRHERAAARGALHRAGERPPAIRRAAVPGEQDHARRLAGVEAPAHVGRHRGAVEARHQKLPDLLAQGERVRRPQGPGRACVRLGRVLLGTRSRAHHHARHERQPRRGGERPEAPPRGRVPRQVHAARQRVVACSATGLPAGAGASSAMPAWRAPSISASSPKPSAGPSAPVPRRPPAAARSAPQARIRPVKV